MELTDKIKKIFLLKSLPDITIYILSNDKFFTTIFFNKFNLEYPYTTREYKDYGMFINEINSIEYSKKKIPIVIVDITFFSDSTSQLNATESLQKTINDKSYIQIIFLESNLYEFSQKTDLYKCIYKNDNAYKRIEQIIFTTSNEFILKNQKKDNKKLFILLSCTIALIILFLVFYILYLL